MNISTLARHHTSKVFLVLLFIVSINQAHSATLINGIARHSELGQESFIGALFTSSPSDSARDIILSDEEKELQVRVLTKRLSARRFRRMWIEGLAINASAGELEKHSENMAKFSNMLKVTLTRGDIFSIQRSEDAVTVIINGAELGTIDDPAFFDLLLRVWIGPVPLSSQFRKDLLVAGEFSNEMINEFNSIKPTDERIINVASALKQANERSARSGASPSVAIAKPKVQQPLVAAPKIEAPKIAATPKPAPAQPKPAPKVAATPAPTPSPKPAEAAKPAQQVAAVSPTPAPAPTEEQPAPEPEPILEEDDEVITAKTLLVQQLYIADLKRWVYKSLKYPTKSVDRNEQGLVRVTVSIDRSGAVQNIELTEESKYKRLNVEARKAVERSSPFPKVPDEIKDPSYTFSVPIVFRLL